MTERTLAKPAPRRPHMTRRASSRFVLVALAAFSLAACGDDPLSPHAVAGTYLHVQNPDLSVGLVDSLVFRGDGTGVLREKVDGRPFDSGILTKSSEFTYRVKGP